MEQFHHDALEIIKQTRDISFPQFGLSEVIAYKSAAAQDVLTEVDQKVEKHLAEQLGKLDSDIAFVGEEYGGDRQAQRKWLVDPIDGTGLFVRGLVGCTTMVALIEHEEVVFGAIYDFVHDKMYSAVKGEGAFCNGQSISVSERPLVESYVAYESKLAKGDNLAIYQAVFNACKPVKHMCAGYEYALVATGQTEGRITLDPYGKDYDYAPGTLLVAEAGGVVTNVGVETFDYQNLSSIAANPVVHKALTEGPEAIFPLTT